MKAPLRCAVFASGAGTTLQALIRHVADTKPQWVVTLLVTDRDRPGAVDKAEAANVDWIRIEDAGRPADEVGQDTLAALTKSQIDVVILAGYLRLVPEVVVDRYEGRMVNTHPGLLPTFGGKGMYGRHVHSAVLQSGARISGPTVHLVDAEYDRGQILAQWPVPVLSGDTPETLAARVQAVERRLYPAVVDHLASSLLAGRPAEPLPIEGSAFVTSSSDPRKKS